MARRKPAKRTFRTLTVKLFDDSDSDIIDWWDGIPEGERSDVLRDMIRSYRSGERKRMVEPRASLEQVADDTAWLRMAINDMPAYLERLIKEVASRAPVEVPQATPVQPVEQRLSEQDKARRASRLNRADW